MDNRWKSSKHAVYNCSYHIIWCPKYRRRVLVDGIEDRLKELLIEKATSNDAPVFIVSQLKAYTSFKLRKEYQKLKSRLPTLWTRSYYVETIGHISEKKIKKYIDDQKNK